MASASKGNYGNGNAATATQQFSLRDYNYNTSQSSTAQYKRTSMHKQETKYEIENINTSVFVVR